MQCRTRANNGCEWPLFESYPSRSDRNRRARCLLNLFSVDERKPMTLPPDTTADEYLIIQENNNNNNQTNSHTPRIRLNITVNRKLKGMYYCLMEKGVLLLDKKFSADYSEYVIPLSEYTFQAVDNFTIKLTKNELEIALLFSSMSDRNTWLSYMAAARKSDYSYVLVQIGDVPTPTQQISPTQNSELPPKLPPKSHTSPRTPLMYQNLNHTSDIPTPDRIVKCKSTENTRTHQIRNPEFVHLSNYQLDGAKQNFEGRLKPHKENDKRSHAPKYNVGNEEKRSIKSINSLPSSRRANLLPFDRGSFKNDVSTDMNNSPLTKSYDSYYEKL